MNKEICCHCFFIFVAKNSVKSTLHWWSTLTWRKNLCVAEDFSFFRLEFLSLAEYFVKTAQSFRGIRKIHGPTDTRTLYTDLLDNIIFWKLEKYTDPIFWQFFRYHKSTLRQTHSTYLESINIRYMEDVHYWNAIMYTLKIVNFFMKSILLKFPTDFPTPKS